MHHVNLTLCLTVVRGNKLYIIPPYVMAVGRVTFGWTYCSLKIGHLPLQLLIDTHQLWYLVLGGGQGHPQLQLISTLAIWRRYFSFPRRWGRFGWTGRVSRLRLTAELNMEKSTGVTVCGSQAWTEWRRIYKCCDLLPKRNCKLPKDATRTVKQQYLCCLKSRNHP